MTKIMNNDQFKKQFKIALCTKNPIEHLIKPENKHDILLQIKNESLDIYGYDLMEECPKRKVCLKKQCLGRPLPLESPTAAPYIKELEKTHTIKNGELFIDANCSNCAISKSCKSLCNEIIDFVRRDYSKDPKVKYCSLTENTVPENEGLKPEILSGTLVIPWDVLTKEKCDIVKKYIYEQRDFNTVAKCFGILNGARAKYFVYAALTKLSEYAIMRQFIRDNKDKLTDTQYNVLYNVYFGNKKITDVALEAQVSKQAVSKIIKQVIEKHKIRWFVFVKKCNNKVIYNVPSLFK